MRNLCAAYSLLGRALSGAVFQPAAGVLRAGAISLPGMPFMLLAGDGAAGLLVGAFTLSIGAEQRATVCMTMQADSVDY
ncbi:hypothetical protein [Rouxiella chamberiensis]|uniref:Uncharacterized protein n=1 Tax=Rouxiella chamberiensis TaxID=1513468 RepID=A0ABY7HS02_9GAMM|nr:hypothetical protein [Rouxiella chamberiensis]WAT01945.1 hypothetical protein O1V66_04400 [Rouxiella chamberiensis]